MVNKYLGDRFVFDHNSPQLSVHLTEHFSLSVGMQITDRQYLNVQDFSRLDRHLELLADLGTSEEESCRQTINGTELVPEQHVVVEHFGVQSGAKDVFISDGMLTCQSK